MLVERILDFIKILNKEVSLPSCDVVLKEKLSTYFLKKSSADELTAEDINYLITCYKSRWEAIIDGEHDYTRNPSNLNTQWINLAREIAFIADINYLKILIPNLSNSIDLNDLSSLNETVNLFNFYLGDGGRVLYRKKSLLKHLESKQFTLSTYRENRQLRPMTIEELARLKLCMHKTWSVSIGTESFETFWALLRNKVFVNLRSQGHMPAALLPYLLELVERFEYLKENGADFGLFKREINNFFQRLYEYPLENINFLYGSKINYNDNEQYLLDVFISLHTGNNYLELDNEVKLLRIFLSTVKVNLKNNENEDFAVEAEQSNDLINCCKLVVSLFTHQFYCTGETLSLWDKENTVFSEATEILNILLPLITANDTQSIEEVYPVIIESITRLTRYKNALNTCFTRNDSSMKWLELAQNYKLNGLNVYWYEPELLFNAVQNFIPNDPALKSRTSRFLDDIIQTYTQNQNDLMKKFRINILFTEFCKGLSEPHRIQVLKFITLCNRNNAKSKFLMNCCKHINDQVATYIEEKTWQFFPPQRKLTSSKSFTLSEEIKDIDQMIVDFKSQSLYLGIEEKKAEKIGNYLFKLGRPILSATQKNRAEELELPRLDYIGQYT